MSASTCEQRRNVSMIELRAVYSYSSGWRHTTVLNGFQGQSSRKPPTSCWSVDGKVQRPSLHSIPAAFDT